MKDSYEFVIIGGGSAGYAAARTAHDLGLKTAVIDGAETLGGLCILRGCMPSKTLIESANRNITLRRAGEFGLSADNISVYPEKIRDRKRFLIDDFASYRQGQLEDGRFDLMLMAYNFMNRDRGNRVLAACKKKNIGTTAMKTKPGTIEIDPFDPENPSEVYALTPLHQ